MSTPFLGEVKIISWNFAPKGWSFCNGQLLPINQNQALFSLLGTTYGGNGITTFALPNLQGRVPVHVGSGIILGQAGGEMNHTLILSEIPAHNHVPVGINAPASAASATGNLWANASEPAYTDTPNTALNPVSVLPTGGSQPHNNMSPYLVLTFCIALT